MWEIIHAEKGEAGQSRKKPVQRKGPVTLRSLRVFGLIVLALQLRTHFSCLSLFFKSTAKPPWSRHVSHQNVFTPPEYN